MKTTETKPTSSASRLQKKSDEPFFGHHKRNGFFSKSSEANQHFFTPKSIQTKPVQTASLTIGEPDDQYEKEADAMADKVVQRLAISETQPAVQAKPIASTATPFIQKKCAACEEEENLQKKEEEDQMQELPSGASLMFENGQKPSDETNIQRKCTECEKEDNIRKKPDTSDTQTTSPNIESHLNASKSSGSTLPRNMRMQMESSFGVDFTNVRVHHDSAAIQMNKDLNAQAFTHGNDIYFAEGKYNTNNTQGKHLLAHELTHVVQQNGKSKDNRIASHNIQRKQELCMPASAWFRIAGVPAPWLTSSAFGFLVEKLIEADYCSTVGCNPLNTYFDDLSPSNYVSFLIRKNPHLAPEKFALWLIATTGLNRPDIIADNTIKREFYEIKPRSISGLSAGIEKLLILKAFYNVYSIPYSYGTSYKPINKKIFRTIVNAGPWPVEVSIRVSYIAPGLLAYDLCVEGELAQIGLAALMLAIIAALIIFQPELSPILIPIIDELATVGAGAAVMMNPLVNKP